MRPDQAPGRRASALTIDVEDYYHAHALGAAFPRSRWHSAQSRVAANTHRLLDLFAQTGASATFFTLGSVAAKESALIRRIVDEGHELASHGWEHWAVHQQDRAAFRQDCIRTRETLENIGATRVRGYRAPSFSIDSRSPWAYEVLAEAGFTYSSSSHPIAHDHYGDPDAPREPFIEPSAGLLEIPISTTEFAGRRWPCGGGGFFRLLPTAWFIANARRRLRTPCPANFYLHPWEIDPGQPRVKAAPLKSRFRHYVGLSRCEAKLRALLRSGPWTRMDEAYHGWFRDSDADGKGACSRYHAS